MDLLYTDDGFSVIRTQPKLTAAATCRPSEQMLDACAESLWGSLQAGHEPSAPSVLPRRQLAPSSVPTTLPLAPLVIRNPVHSRKLEEPIERKREYWSDNLLYIMRREGLIPRDYPVVMDRPTPEQPYRLSANVVRLLEQEPHLYTAKSNIKLPNFDPTTKSRNDEEATPLLHDSPTRARTPFTYSQASQESIDVSDSFSSGYVRPSQKCCQCGLNSGLNSGFNSDFDLGFGLIRETPRPSPSSPPHAHRKAHSFSGGGGFKSRSFSPSSAHSRHYSTTIGTSSAAKRAEVPRGKRLIEWNPVNYQSMKASHVGSDKTSVAIQRLWKTKRQLKHTYENKLKMKDYLERSIFSDCKLWMTGSSKNGFGFDNADVDFYIELKNNFLCLNRDPTNLLRALKAQMAGVAYLRRPTVIGAVCPLLTFTYKKKLGQPFQVELNTSSKVGIVNTQLLFAYSRMDARVAPLVGACKHWAATMDIKDAQRGLLSSYSISLMVIYFLQQMNVVPVLHNMVPEFQNGRGFSSDDTLLLPKWSSPNAQDIGSLFRDLLYFYSTFDFTKNCISVRDGAVLSVKEAIERDPDTMKYKSHTSRDWWGIVNVQEPFTLTNTARSVSRKDRLVEISNALKVSYQTISRKDGIDVLFGHSNPDLKSK